MTQTFNGRRHTNHRNDGQGEGSVNKEIALHYEDLQPIYILLNLLQVLLSVRGPELITTVTPSLEEVRTRVKQPHTAFPRFQTMVYLQSYNILHK